MRGCLNISEKEIKFGEEIGRGNFGVIQKYLMQYISMILSCLSTLTETDISNEGAGQVRVGVIRLCEIFDVY